MKMHLEPLEGRRYFTVYTVAPGGSDSAAGSAAAPFATLQHAANVVRAGDIVNVLPGDYAGFHLETSGTSSAPITFNASPGAVIDGAPGTFNGAIDISFCNNIIIQGFNISPGPLAVYQAGIWGGGQAGENTVGDVIANNTINDADRWGILMGFTTGVVVQNNTVANTQVQHGIYIGNSSVDGIIKGNTCYGNRGAGIEINADSTQGGTGISTGMVIEDNILFDDAIGIGGYINLDGVQDSVIENNLLYGGPLGQRNGIALYQTDGAEPSKDNLIINNTIDIDDNGPAGYAAISIIDGSTGNAIFNNILSSAENSLAFDPASLPGTQSDYNIWGASGSDSTGEGYVNNVSLGTWQAQTGLDRHSRQTSEISSLFVNVAQGQSQQNFNLASSSLAIGAGTISESPLTDIFGNPREGRNDVGAYQYIASPPTAPNTLAGTQGSLPRHVELTWQAALGAATYQVFRGTSIDSMTKIASGLTSTSFADTTATPGVVYYYAVRAVNSAGVGPLLGYVSGYKPGVAPSGLAATQGTLPRHVSVTWNALPGAISYQVFRGTSSNGGVKVAAGLTYPGYNDLSATPGVTYYYWVRAVFQTGLGPMAGPVSGYRPVQQAVVTNPNIAGSSAGFMIFAGAYAISFGDGEPDDLSSLAFA